MRTGMAARTAMIEAGPGAQALRLQHWLSPAFPVGAFAYSHGIERAIHDAVIVDRSSLTAWLEALLVRGTGWNDAVLLAAAWRGALDGTWREVAELAAAMAGSRERHLETSQQGEAFGLAMDAWGAGRPESPTPKANPPPPHAEVLASGQPRSTRDRSASFEARLLRAPQDEEVVDEPTPYPVAVGIAARRHAIALAPTLVAYLHAFASNLVGAALRLVPLGQSDGVATLATLEPAILGTARRAAASTLDDLGACTIMSEIAAMRHETQYSRVFRT